MPAKQAILFDWGDTVMRVFPDEEGPMASWCRVESTPGIVPVAAALRHSASIALATNAADSTESQIWEALARGGLDDLFDSVYCLRGVGHRKPSGEFFDAVLADLRVERSHAFMVGDDFAGDVEGANAAGLAAIWYAPQSAVKPVGPAYRTIHQFAELPAALVDLGFQQHPA